MFPIPAGCSPAKQIKTARKVSSCCSFHSRASDVLGSYISKSMKRIEPHTLQTVLVAASVLIPWQSSRLTVRDCWQPSWFAGRPLSYSTTNRSLASRPSPVPPPTAPEPPVRLGAGRAPHMGCLGSPSGGQEPIRHRVKDERRWEDLERDTHRSSTTTKRYQRC